MVKILLSNTSISNFYLRNVKSWIDKALKLRNEKMKVISPTDTGDYIRSHKTKQATISWNSVKWANINDSAHAFGVEFWFRKTPVNRHKWPPRNSSTVIYSGVGARVMNRTVEDTKQQTIDLIVNSLNRWLNK